MLNIKVPAVAGYYAVLAVLLFIYWELGINRSYMYRHTREYSPSYHLPLSEADSGVTELPYTKRVITIRH